MMNVTGDRNVEHGLATIGFDDEGVAPQPFDIVRDGVFVGYQLNRQMARSFGHDASNGCSFADSPGHLPLQRMPNVSLQPDEHGPSLERLIGDVENGIYADNPRAHLIEGFRISLDDVGELEQRPTLHLELRDPDTEPDAALSAADRTALADTVRAGVVAHLRSVSRDFAESLEEDPTAAGLRVRIHDHGTGPFSRRSTKIKNVYLEA